MSDDQQAPPGLLSMLGLDPDRIEKLIADRAPSERDATGTRVLKVLDSSLRSLSSPAPPLSPGELAAAVPASRPSDLHVNGDGDGDVTPDEAVPADTPEAKRENFMQAARARLRLSRSGEDQTFERQVRDVPLDRIDSTAIKNIRQQTDEAKRVELRESMGRHGLLHPITLVELPNGRFGLAQGFRRFEAARDLRWQTIPATVLPVGTPDEALYWVNTIENIHRDSVPLADVADRIAFMIQRFNCTQKELSRRLGAGYSQPRISNLLRFRDLPSEIVADWRAGLAREAVLERLCMMSPQDASAQWAIYRSRLVAPAAEVSNVNHYERRLLRRGSGRRPSAAVLHSLAAAIRRHELSDETRRIALAIVDFAAGVAPSVPRLYDPRRPGARLRRPPTLPRRDEAELEFPKQPQQRSTL